MNPVRHALAPLAAAAVLLAGCSQVDAEGGDAEVQGFLDAAREELAEGRAALADSFEGELRVRVEHLVDELEAAATRIGAEHADELQDLLASEREGFERTLDAIEARGAASWHGARTELEAGVDRLAGLLERWAAEAARPEPEGAPPGPAGEAR